MSDSCCESFPEEMFLWIWGAFNSLIKFFLSPKELLTLLQTVNYPSLYLEILFVLVVFILWIGDKAILRLLHKVNKNSLEAQITAENNKHYKRNWNTKIEDFWIWLGTPSRELYAWFVILFIILFCLSHTRLILPDLYIGNAESNSVQTLITVIAGIGAVLFALIIFIAQIGRDGAGPYTVRVYLLHTKLLLLVTLCLTAMVLTLGPQLNVLLILILLVLFFLTINAVFWVVRLTLSPSQLEISIDKLIRRELILHVQKSINRRIGQNILRKFLKEQGGLVEFSPMLIHRDSFNHITLLDHGLVADINLRLLGQALSIIRNGTASKIDDSDGVNEPRISKEESGERKTYGFILKSIGDEIEGDRQGVFSIKKNALDGQLFDQLDGLISNAFKISTSSRHISDDLRIQFREIRQKFITALKNSPGSNVDTFVRTYANLSEEFIKVLQRYPDRYDLKLATEEIANEFWGQSWEEVGWLHDDIKEILTYALRNAETIQAEALLSVLYLPIAICYRAIQNTDNFLFQKFLPLLVKHCRLGNRINNAELRELVLDRCIRYPKELVDYYIIPKLKKRNHKQADRERLGDSLIFLFSIYFELVREAYLNGNTKLVEKLIAEINDCADDFSPENDRWNTKHLRWRLESATSEIEKIKLKDDLEEQEFLEGLNVKIVGRKQATLYGIACRLLDAVIKDSGATWADSLTTVLNFLPDQFIDLFNISKLVNTLDGRSSTFIDKWERESLEGLHWIGSDSNSAEILCIKLLMSINSLDITEIDPTHITDDMGYQCEVNGVIHRAIDSILAKKAQLSGILSPEQFNSTDKLRDLLAKVVTTQKKNELNVKQNSKLSKNRIQDFTNEFVNEFHESITIRLILDHHFKCYKVQLEGSETKDTIPIGFNRIEDKAIFIEPWPAVSYQGWGKAYGEGLARAEDSVLLNKLKKFVSLEVRGNLEKCLRSTGGGILILVNVNSFLFFKDFSWEFTEEYLIKDRKKVPGFSGELKVEDNIMPVYSIYAPNLEAGILLLSPELEIEIQQVAPFSRENETYTLESELGIEITDLNEDEVRRRKFIRNSPAWLIKESTDVNEQEAYLRGRVQIIVVEKMNIISRDISRELVNGFWIPMHDKDCSEI